VVAKGLHLPKGRRTTAGNQHSISIQAMTKEFAQVGFKDAEGSSKILRTQENVFLNTQTPIER